MGPHMSRAGIPRQDAVDLLYLAFPQGDLRSPLSSLRWSDLPFPLLGVRDCS